MQPISLLASGSRAATGLPRDASAPGQEGVSEPEKPSQPARRDRGRKRDARTHEGKSRRLKCQAGTDTLPREGQAWHPGSTLNSGRPSPTAHPRRPARPVHPPAPITRDSPVASRPQGWTTMEDAPAGWTHKAEWAGGAPSAELQTEAGSLPGSSPSLLTGAPLSIAYVWAATLHFGSQNITTGASPVETSRFLWKVTGSFIISSRAELILGETINCPDPDESRDERCGAVSSQAGHGGL